MSGIFSECHKDPCATPGFQQPKVKKKPATENHAHNVRKAPILLRETLETLWLCTERCVQALQVCEYSFCQYYWDKKRTLGKMRLFTQSPTPRYLSLQR